MLLIAPCAVLWAQAACAVVTAAFPYHHTRDASGAKQLVVPDASLLVHSRGRLSPTQLAAALDTCRRGCEGVAKFVVLALTSSFKASEGPAGCCPLQPVMHAAPHPDASCTCCQSVCRTPS